VLRLAVAAALGGAVGVEREIREREAGIRTHLLVAVGAALFTLVGAYAFHGSNVDDSRVAAQVVTGIGFLGAGAIIREGLSVRGLTTAASLWVVAAAGMAAGAGYYWAAVVATALTVFALWPLRILSYHLIQRLRPEENRLIIELKPGELIAPLLAELQDVQHFEVDEERDRRVVTIEASHLDEDVVAKLSDLDYVIGIRWRR
jgi:putative Mg2+ transporter-C (MgtC) family protein